MIDSNPSRLSTGSGAGRFVLLAAGLSLFCGLAPRVSAHVRTSAASQLWRFDRLDRVAGYSTQIVGHPQVETSAYGSVIHFNGVNDALIIEDHPLAGAVTWTSEVIFEPDADGAPQQRFFHLSVRDGNGHDLSDRMLFEIRIVNGAWCLDSFAGSGEHKLALLNCQKRYPPGRWYRVAAVYDGTTLSSYVGDDLQAQGRVALAPQGMGRSSIGMRINHQDFFKGAVFASRFTPVALGVDQFLALPATSLQKKRKTR